MEEIIPELFKVLAIDRAAGDDNYQSSVVAGYFGMVRLRDVDEHKFALSDEKIMSPSYFHQPVRYGARLIIEGGWQPRGPWVMGRGQRLEYVFDVEFKAVTGSLFFDVASGAHSLFLWLFRSSENVDIYQVDVNPAADYTKEPVEDDVPF